MARVARTTDTAKLDQRNESRLRELDRRVTTVLTQDTTWPRGLIGYVSSTGTKTGLVAITNLLGLTFSAQLGRTYAIRAHLGMYNEHATLRGLLHTQITIAGTRVLNSGKALEIGGWVETQFVETIYVPSADVAALDVILRVEPDLGGGFSYGIYGASNYPLWLSVTDTGPATALTATTTIY